MKLILNIYKNQTAMIELEFSKEKVEIRTWMQSVYTNLTSKQCIRRGNNGRATTNSKEWNENWGKNCKYFTIEGVAVVGEEDL